MCGPMADGGDYESRRDADTLRDASHIRSEPERLRKAHVHLAHAAAALEDGKRGKGKRGKRKRMR